MQQPIPVASWPMVGPNGVLNDIWYRFFQALYSRTGGATGTPPAPVIPDLTALRAAVGDINTVKIPALQQGIADAGLLASVSEDASPAPSQAVDPSLFNDLRVLALTQED